MADITAIALEQRFNDGSGSRLKVSFDLHDSIYAGRVRIEASEEIVINAEDLDWLIEALQQVRTIEGRLSERTPA